MAKYILPSIGRGTHKIPCVVIGADLLNENYTVKFRNGVVRTVHKSSLKDLDAIDEALIDKIKGGARRISGAIKNIYNKIVYTGKAVYTAILGVAAPHLGNIMLAAEDERLDFLGFIPSDDVAKDCEAAGIEPTQTIVDLEDPEICDDINNYWYKKMDRGTLAEEPVVAESVRTSRACGLRVRGSRRFTLNEAEAKIPDIMPVDGRGGHPILNRDTACRYIAEQFDARYSGVTSEEAPILLWGAPGIGKTQIVTSLGDMLSKRYNGKVNVITINAMGFRKDSISLPGFETREQEFYGADGRKFVVPVRVPKDYVKSWLPTYDPEMAVEIVEKSKKLGREITREDAIKILDNIANGGHPANPETGEEYLEGNGGIIFIDEVARISTEVLQVFMSFLQSRVLNGQVLGSRWIFVGASNRFTDLSERLKKQVAWEAAWGDRFSQYNFVPSVKEWLAWGAEEVEIDGEMRTRIDPDVLMYIKSNPSMYYSAASADKTLADETARDRFPNPRSWKAYTDAKRNSERYAKKFGERLTQQELRDKLHTQVGAKAADNYFAWLNGPGKDLSNEDAAAIWTLGAKSDAKRFTSETQILGAHGALLRIINMHPDVVKDIPQEERVLTPKQFENITEYLLACVDETANNKVKQSSASSLAATINNDLLKYIKEHFPHETYKTIVNSAINKNREDLRKNPYIKGLENMHNMIKWSWNTNNNDDNE